MDFYQAILAETGYKPKTTFWSDFLLQISLAEKPLKTHISVLLMGGKPIPNTSQNWLWSYAETNPAIGIVYQDLWEELDSWCFANLKDDALQYYIKTTD